MAHRTFRIFLSSPGDVPAERDWAQAVVERLNAEQPGAPLFSLTRWEQSYYTATHAFQDQIPRPGEHDVVVFLFWKRLGTDLPPAYDRADGTSRTGTEFEFEDARDARERRGDLPDILVYRKTARVLFSEEHLEAERAQKKALDQFWERWFRTDTGHYIAGFQSFADAADFEQQFERNLREWLQRHHAGQVTWSIARQGSPYRGLAAFEEEHAALFFGRDADMARARARFIEAGVGQESGRRGTPFLLILGASGSGKSSFLRAGLVPRMRAAGVPAFLEDGSDAIHAFRTLVIVPRELGENLCSGFATALYRSGGGHGGTGLPELAGGDYPTAEAFAALAAASPASAAAPVIRALDRAEPGAGAEEPARRLGLLLGIDQLEELFSRPDTDRHAFVALLAALAATGRVWIVATMRNDFYDRLRQDPDLSALTDRGRIYDLAPPGRSDYRDIIRQPAQAAGLRFEATAARDLAADIEAEAGGEGALPMIAFLLEQLFQERRGELLTLETYDRLGGAAGALSEQGDRILDALPTEVRDAFPRVVRRLVRKSLKDLAPTATAAPLDAFPQGSAERRLIHALAAGRLLQLFTVERGGSSAPSAWARWSHEALLTQWPRLRNSVDADRRDYETLDRLQGACALWRETPAAQQGERLLADLALAESADLVKRWGADVDETLRRFVAESEARAHARRIRRRRVRTAVFASLSVLAVAASIASVLAIKQRNLARDEQAAADRTASFMESLFKIADPGENRGNSMTVREMLDRGAADIGTGLQHDPGIRADVLTAMGQAYSGLGLYDPAKKLLAQARSDQNAVAVPAESRVRTLDASGSTLYLAGDYDQAGRLLQAAVDEARRSLPAADVLRSQALDDLADLDVQLEKYGAAEKLASEALAADRRRGPDQAAMQAHTLDTLGSVYYYRGDLPAADSTMREALALHQQVSGLNDAATAVAMNNLAAALYQEGRYEENMALLEQALPVYKGIYGPDHPQVASVLNNLGRSAMMLGRIDDAEPMLRQSLAMMEKLEGATHDDLVWPLNSLAMIDGYEGDLEQAGAEIQRAEAIARLPDHGALLDQVLLTAADLALQEGRWDPVAASLTESRKLLQAAHPLDKQPQEAWRYAIWDTVDAEWLAHQGDVVAARAKIAAALPVITRRYGQKGFYVLLTHRREQFIEQQAHTPRGGS